MGWRWILATRTLCFDTRMLRQTNGFVAAHHLSAHALMNKTGSYVCSVNVEARVFDPACAALQLIDAQSRRQDEWTTEDPALVRGLATA
jgi:hypothetical protein